MTDRAEDIGRAASQLQQMVDYLQVAAAGTPVDQWARVFVCLGQARATLNVLDRMFADEFDTPKCPTCGDTS